MQLYIVYNAQTLTKLISQSMFAAKLTMNSTL